MYAGVDNALHRFSECTAGLHFTCLYEFSSAGCLCLTVGAQLVSSKFKPSKV
jgi:hypothetical protein